MSFGQILSRGFAAAHRVPVGFALYFLLFGVSQGLSVILGGAFSADAAQMQPGGKPSPQLIAIMAFGCFSCLWGLLSLMAGPWVTGGVVGQLRDRLSDRQAGIGKFAEYGGRYYGRMLVLALIWLAIFAVLAGALMAVGAAIVASQIEPGQQLQPEQLPQMNRHPANIVAGLVAWVLITAVGVVWSLAQTLVVLDDKGAVDALHSALRFCRRHRKQVGLLLLVSLLVSVPFWVPGQLLAALEVKQLAARAIAGVFVALYFPYMIMLGLGWGVSLCLAHHRDSVPELTDRV